MTDIRAWKVFGSSSLGGNTKRTLDKGNRLSVAVKHFARTREKQQTHCR